jgi:hypothetical protein
MGKIGRYASTSNLMEIAIHYGNEKFRFNLFEELVVNENKINTELKEQPSCYGFISMLQKKLIRRMKDKEKEKDKVYGKLYLKYRSELCSETGRYYSDDMAKQKVIIHNDYQKAVEELIIAEEEVGIITSCVRSFEQRSDLIQTISANLRRER